MCTSSSGTELWTTVCWCAIFCIPLPPPSFTLRPQRYFISNNFIIRVRDRCLHYYICPRLACHCPFAGQRPVLRGPLHRHRPSPAQGGIRLLRLFKTLPYYSVRWCYSWVVVVRAFRLCGVFVDMCLVSVCVVLSLLEEGDTSLSRFLGAACAGRCGG